MRPDCAPFALPRRKATFHVSNGLYFTVLTDGTVDLCVTDGKPPWEGGTVLFNVEMTKRTWASVVSSMGAEGETFDSWHEARLKHLGAQRYLAEELLTPKEP